MSCLKRKQIFPVFLILVRRDNAAQNRTAESKVLNLATKHEVLVLDYRNKINSNAHLGDKVCTNYLGVKINAEALINDFPIVFEEFKKFKGFVVVYKNEASLEPQFVINEAQCKRFPLIKD